MNQYLEALETILKNGTGHSDRTGVGTRSIFGMQLRFDLNEGFPAVTTKKLAWKAVCSELLWFIEGSTDERRLAEIHYGQQCYEVEGRKTIWTANADKQGVDLGYVNTPTQKELGPVYGSQWRDWKGPGGVRFDQLAWVIDRIKTSPDCRRIIMSSWNASEISKMALPPCHVMAQFRVYDGKLSCMLTQRSADMLLGAPFNYASYALLTHMIAQVCGLGVGELVWSGGDCHVYNNHIEQCWEQISREPLSLPDLWLNPNIKDINDFTMADIQLMNYESHAAIKAEMAV